uniref:C-X-C motif chemokine 10-like n=1 Tax=Pristiophorus japonicus TaxID=55135 RepID=UPI00398E7FD6
MNSRVIVTVLMLLGLCAAFTQGAPVDKDKNTRCQCAKYENKKIPLKQIKEIDMFPIVPGCSHVEIIAGVLQRKNTVKICLKVEEPWVKELIDKLLQEHTTKTTL